MSIVEPYLRRDYKISREKDYWPLITLILWMLAIATWAYVLTPTVKADELSYKDVHTEAQACAWLHAHPGRIKGVTWCNL